MKWIKTFRRMPAFAIALLLTLPAVSLGTEDREFTIELSDAWMELPLPLQGVEASYGKKGTLATFHIIERDLDEVRDVEDLRWEDLFSPEFASIDIRAQGPSMIGGEKARFCFYGIKPGGFKKAMEGGLPAKYINHIVVHGGKLFSITFKDTEEGFAMTYPSFLAAMRTLRFHTPVANVTGKKP